MIFHLGLIQQLQNVSSQAAMNDVLSLLNNTSTNLTNVILQDRTLITYKASNLFKVANGSLQNFTAFISNQTGGNLTNISNTIANLTLGIINNNNSSVLNMTKTVGTNVLLGNASLTNITGINRTNTTALQLSASISNSIQNISQRNAVMV